MDVMGKMVELLEPHMSGLACEYESGSCELTSCRSCNARNIADHLISNGVTVQEWISVKDRLPEPTYCVLVVGAYSEMAIDALGTDGEWMGMVEDITHWMPLPQPPKVV